MSRDYCAAMERIVAEPAAQPCLQLSLHASGSDASNLNSDSDALPVLVKPPAAPPLASLDHDHQAAVGKLPPLLRAASPLLPFDEETAESTGPDTTGSINLRIPVLAAGITAGAATAQHGSPGREQLTGGGDLSSSLLASASTEDELLEVLSIGTQEAALATAAAPLQPADDNPGADTVYSQDDDELVLWIPVEMMGVEEGGLLVGAPPPPPPPPIIQPSVLGGSGSAAPPSVYSTGEPAVTGVPRSRGVGAQASLSGQAALRSSSSSSAGVKLASTQDDKKAGGSGGGGGRASIGSASGNSKYLNSSGGLRGDVRALLQLMEGEVDEDGLEDEEKGAMQPPRTSSGSRIYGSGKAAAPSIIGMSASRGSGAISYPATPVAQVAAVWLESVGECGRRSSTRNTSGPASERAAASSGAAAAATPRQSVLPLAGSAEGVGVSERGGGAASTAVGEAKRAGWPAVTFAPLPLTTTFAVVGSTSSSEESSTLASSYRQLLKMTDGTPGDNASRPFAPSAEKPPQQQQQQQQRPYRQSGQQQRVPTVHSFSQPTASWRKSLSSAPATTSVPTFSPLARHGHAATVGTNISLHAAPPQLPSIPAHVISSSASSAATAVQPPLADRQTAAANAAPSASASATAEPAAVAAPRCGGVMLRGRSVSSHSSQRSSQRDGGRMAGGNNTTRGAYSSWDSGGGNVTFSAGDRDPSGKSVRGGNGSKRVKTWRAANTAPAAAATAVAAIAAASAAPSAALAGAASFVDGDNEADYDIWSHPGDGVDASTPTAVTTSSPLFLLPVPVVVSAASPLYFQPHASSSVSSPLFLLPFPKAAGAMASSEDIVASSGGNIAMAASQGSSSSVNRRLEAGSIVEYSQATGGRKRRTNQLSSAAVSDGFSPSAPASVIVPERRHFGRATAAAAVHSALPSAYFPTPVAAASAADASIAAATATNAAVSAATAPSAYRPLALKRGSVGAPSAPSTSMYGGRSSSGGGPTTSSGAGGGGGSASGDVWALDDVVCVPSITTRPFNSQRGPEKGGASARSVGRRISKLSGEGSSGSLIQSGVGVAAIAPVLQVSSNGAIRGGGAKDRRATFSGTSASSLAAPAAVPSVASSTTAAAAAAAAVVVDDAIPAAPSTSRTAGGKRGRSASLSAGPPVPTSEAVSAVSAVPAPLPAAASSTAIGAHTGDGVSAGDVTNGGCASGGDINGDVTGADDDVTGAFGPSRAVAVRYGGSRAQNPTTSAGKKVLRDREHARESIGRLMFNG